MISNVTIKNYKSVVNVSLPLGRFNVIIGANGCGKSNILEGIALGAAASSNKLDYEYFANRGMRVVEPQYMFPAFEGITSDNIVIEFKNEKDKTTTFNIHYNKDAKPAIWEDDSISVNDFVSIVKSNSFDNNPNLKKLQEDITEIFKQSELFINGQIKIRKKGTEILIEPKFQEIEKFLIYSLEESKLRNADNSNRIFPMGRHGEGLFAYLKELYQRPNSKVLFDEIKENLQILDWFDDMQIPTSQLSNEFNVELTDNYLDDVKNFDQRSTNEGFLYLLFYLTLVISDETPSFFAIENIDTAFNPKLCREVVRRLILLARKHNKQIIATTHNAAILDGLNLKENDINLCVARRSIDGYTTINRVVMKDDISMPLSEAWLNGFIGGLPDNF